MDRVSTFGLIDPDHDQPAGVGRPADHLVCLPLRHMHFDTIRIGKDLLDLLPRDASLRMLLAEMLAVGDVPDDWPIVHPESIYDLIRRSRIRPTRFMYPEGANLLERGWQAVLQERRDRRQLDLYAAYARDPERQAVARAEQQELVRSRVF